MVEVNNKLLKTRVLESGLSYSAIAKEANVSKSTIHNLILGRHAPSHHLTTHLAIILNFTQTDFNEVFYPNLKFAKELLND